jgi:hypothetical protein
MQEPAHGGLAISQGCDDGYVLQIVGSKRGSPPFPLPTRDKDRLPPTLAKTLFHQSPPSWEKPCRKWPHWLPSHSPVRWMISFWASSSLDPSKNGGAHQIGRRLHLVGLDKRMLCEDILVGASPSSWKMRAAVACCKVASLGPDSHKVTTSPLKLDKHGTRRVLGAITVRQQYCQTHLSVRKRLLYD